MITPHEDIANRLACACRNREKLSGNLLKGLEANIEQLKQELSESFKRGDHERTAEELPPVRVNRVP